MAYYTQFTLHAKIQPGYTAKRRCEHPQPDGAKFCPECGVKAGTISTSELARLIEADEKLKPLGITLSCMTERMSWYENDKDMREVSSRFPGVLFTLEGTGEEPGDLWRSYFYDGQGYRVKASFPEFNAAQLK